MRRKTPYDDLPKLAVLCEPCHQAGKRRVLLHFDLGPGDEPSIMPYIDDGEKVWPRWSGPGEGSKDGKVHRTCSCGHPAQVSRASIAEALNTGERILYR